MIRTALALGIALTLALAARPARASCSAPELQVSPTYGMEVPAACPILIAVPTQGYAVDLGTVALGWSGGVIAVDLSAPTKVTVQQSEAFIDPETCDEYTESWDIEFLTYTLTPREALPRDETIQILVGGDAVGDFKVSETATYCNDTLTPTVGMCGSGGPAPVEGCDWPPSSTTGGEGTGQLEERSAGGCSLAGHGTSSPLLLLPLIALVSLRRRRG